MKANCAVTCPTARASACTARTTPRPCAACIWTIWCWTSPPTSPARSGARSCAPLWPTGRDGPCSAARPRAVTICCTMSGSWRAVWGRRRAGHAFASRPRRQATCRKPSWTPPAGAWAWTAPSGNSTDAGPATCWTATSACRSNTSARWWMWSCPCWATPCCWAGWPTRWSSCWPSPWPCSAPASSTAPWTASSAGWAPRPIMSRPSGWACCWCWSSASIWNGCPTAAPTATARPATSPTAPVIWCCRWPSWWPATCGITPT